MNRRDFLAWSAAFAMQKPGDPHDITLPIWALDVDGNVTVTPLDVEVFDARARFGPIVPRPIVLCWNHYAARSSL